jgi:undecaprenyl-diphosphatase
VFNVVIQAGAILAVTLIYRQRLWQLLTRLGQRENRDYAAKLTVAFLITGALGLIVKKLGFKLPTALSPIAWALLLGGFWILAAEWLAAKKPDRTQVTWTVAIVVGLAQIIAGVFPGTSRSGATIFAAMLTGTSNRAAATEFAFLVGIPTMFAASAAELYDALKQGGTPENWGDLGLGFVVSMIVAFIAVKWLLRYIQTHRFTLFAWYRIVLGASLLAFVR